MSKGSTSKTLVWILMALLILGLGGFGVTNLSSGASSVGEVGGKTITINAYSRALDQELRALGAQTGRTVTFAEAQAAGVDRVVLSRLVLQRAMDSEAERIGISMGDENLRDELMQIEAFQGVDGQFDREAYRFAIDQAGMNEADFEESIREETVRGLLQAAVMAGATMPDTYTDALLAFISERRSFDWARLEAADLAAPIDTPDEAGLMAFYEANIADYTNPRMRQITYAWLSPDQLIDSVEVDEEALKTLYEQRIGDFVRPERRLVERLAFADEAAAQAALDRFTRGEVSFEGLVEERGLELSDVDLGDVTAADLGNAGDIVFAATAGALVGPAPSDLGPAIFRINGVLPALSVSFEDARAELREELAAERARRRIDSLIGEVDDMLAAGATLEELASETEMELGSIGWHEAESTGIAGYESFRAAAGAVQTEDFPQVEQMADGGIFALRLDGETDAAPIPFAEVETQVAEDWQRAETVRLLGELADGLAPQLTGDVPMTSFGLTPRSESDLDRSGFVADTPQGFMATVFEMQPGEARVMRGPDSVYLIRLTSVADADLSDPRVNGLRMQIGQQTANALSQDIFEAYGNALRSEIGMSLNQQTLNAVHTQFQ